MRDTHDAIEHVRNLLLQDGVSEADLKAIDRQVRDEVNAAAEFALSDPEPDPSQLTTDVLV